jgi:prepilin-type N-terminal cleavage/methylation domain-containing protein
MIRARRGVTLVELLAVLALLGVATGVAGLAFRAPGLERPTNELAFDRVASARHEAIVTGRSVSTTVVIDGRPRAVTAHADGRVLADSMAALDALSGRPAPKDTSHGSG